jgi:hypothetical protein
MTIHPQVIALSGKGNGRRQELNVFTLIHDDRARAWRIAGLGQA